MKPPCLMLKQLSYFVGRKTTLQEIAEALQDTGFLYLDVLEGVEGIGKTTLLIKLYADLQEDQKYHPVWVCMSVFDPIRKGESIDPNALSTLIANLDDYRGFLLELAAELQSEIFSDFNNYVNKVFSSTLDDLIKQNSKIDLGGISIQTGDIHVGAFSRLAEGQLKTGDVIVQVPDHALRMTVDNLKNSITSEFLQRVNQLKKNWRFVFLIDNFQLVINSEVGKWFLSGLVSNLDNAVVVLAKTKTSTAALTFQGSLTIHLDNFSFADVEGYLKKRLNLTSLSAKLTESIYNYTGGHPQAVVLAVDLCQSFFKKGKSTEDFLSIFTEIPVEHTLKIIKLVDQIMDSIDDDTVKKALEIGWVVRRFDSDLLRYLLSQGPTDSTPQEAQKYQNIVSRLEGYSFVENHDEFYKFHDFIRQAMEMRLKKDDPQRYKEIHRLVASYYSEKLLNYDKDRKDESSFLRWFRYESYEWQCLIAEWLFHLKNTPEQFCARLIFLKVYFDAFWWWGAYEPFPFCERLLSEWSRTQMSVEDEEWFRHLKNFHNAFPTGYQKRGQGNWNQVKTSLICLRQLGGFDGDTSKLDSDQRHLQAMTAVFLSQAHFYEELKDPKAEEYLLEALQILKEDEDVWNVGWTLFHLANVYVHWGKNTEAFARVQEALALALQENPSKRDYEVIANIHRVIADVCWQQEKLERSFRHYAVAVLSAYIYHGVPSPADLYTQSFHREMIERTLHRLESLWLAGKKSETLKFCQQLQDFFGLYWKLVNIKPDGKDFEKFFTENRTQDLSQILFPRLPTDEELNKRGIDYTDQARRGMGEMGEEIEAVI